MKGLVSVVMPIHNEPRIELAIDSLLAQTYQNFEIIVVDDGSDNLDYVRHLRDVGKTDKIKFFFLPTHTNIATAINRGYDEARGEFIARHDGDDISAPTRLERQVAFLRSSELGACSCQYEYVETGQPHPQKWELPTDPEEIYLRILTGNCIGGGYWMAYTDTVRAIGHQTWDFPGCADWEWWILYTRQFKVGVVNEVLYHICWKDKDPKYLEMQRESGTRLRRKYEALYVSLTGESLEYGHRRWWK